MQCKKRQEGEEGKGVIRSRVRPSWRLDVSPSHGFISSVIPLYSELSLISPVRSFRPNTQLDDDHALRLGQARPGHHGTGPGTSHAREEELGKSRPAVRDPARRRLGNTLTGYQSSGWTGHDADAAVVSTDGLERLR